MMFSKFMMEIPMRRFGPTLIASLCILPLAACGGSDGGIASTPAPPPAANAGNAGAGSNSGSGTGSTSGTNAGSGSSSGTNAGAGAGSNSGGNGTPSPAANQMISNLVATEQFGTASATLTGTFTDPADVPSNVNTSVSNGVGQAVTLSYDALNLSYTISINQGGISDQMTYGANHRDNDPPSGFIEYERDAANGDDTTLLLRRAGAGGTNLSYVNYGLWERDIDLAGNSDLERWAMFVYGLRTSGGQLPVSGTASYRGTLDGLWTTALASYRLSGASEFTADFAANSLRGTLTATGRDRENGAMLAMDTLTGTASISRADATFAGGLTGSGGFAGNWVGGFFGPGASEVGGSFSVSRGAERAAGVFVAGK